MKKITVMCLFIIICTFFSCGLSGPGGIYITHVNEVYSILLKNTRDSAKAADEVYAYVIKNRKQIEDALEKMKLMSVKETEKIQGPVIREVNVLLEYIKNQTTDEYPLDSEAKLAEAFAILIK